jgi:hypothetical protein
MDYFIDIEKSWKGDSQGHSEAAKKRGSSEKYQTKSKYTKNMLSDMGFDFNTKEGSVWKNIEIRSSTNRKGFSSVKIDFRSAESRKKAFKERQKIAKKDEGYDFTFALDAEGKIVMAQARSAEDIKLASVAITENGAPFKFEYYKTEWAEKYVKP